MTLLQHQVDKLILPRDEHLRIAIVIFIVPFIVNVCEHPYTNLAALIKLSCK